MALLDRRDILFLLEFLQVETLLDRERFAELTAEEIAAILDVAEQIAEEVLAPHLRAGDLNEPRFEGDRVRVLPEAARAVGVIAQAGFFSSIFDRAHGGLQLPHVIHIAALGLLMSGNLSTASFPLLT